MSMKDRRARLRPKQGARQLYYNLVNTSGVNLFSNQIPFLGNSGIGGLSPNAPNILTGLSNNITNTASNLINGATNTLSNISNSLSSSFFSPNNSIGRSFGNGSGASVYGGEVNILAPLAETDGLVWPFTPTIRTSQSAVYNSYDIVHSNQEFLAYARTKAPEITVSGQFVVQNGTEASYALACVHFLRTIVKMSFGQNNTQPGSPQPGTPPPILIFSAYGEYMFNELPVIVQNFNIDFPNDVDYILVPNTDTLVPSLFSIDITMTVQNIPARLTQFNLDKFRSGSLLKNGGWI